jgi:hypothetical protein
VVELKCRIIFPGEREYHDATFNAALLVMPVVKSTSKDRCVGQASRLSPIKLKSKRSESGATPDLRNRADGIRLHPISARRGGEGEAQLNGMLSVTEFVEFVRRKQTK